MHEMLNTYEHHLCHLLSKTDDKLTVIWLHRMQHWSTTVLAFKHCNSKHRVLINTRKKRKRPRLPADTNTDLWKKKKKKSLIFLAIAVHDKRRRKLKKVRSSLEMSSPKKPNQVYSPTEVSPKAFNLHLSCSSHVHSKHLHFISSLDQISCCLDTVSHRLVTILFL